ncbi:hypothetical protein GIS00_05770 [Nakamurella sp. YIM 132087]|uniref:Uncharacterized protein n=1 Tax=Nakamurella alba TaxID=2665158 RepID=A0A7K1FH55_9ACTN|nr:hypothetical protein [Nakamurella alba]MTD13452.1 hypothetical protein [Nakamurella alba]
MSLVRWLLVALVGAGVIAMHVLAGHDSAGHSTAGHGVAMSALHHSTTIPAIDRSAAPMPSDHEQAGPAATIDGAMPAACILFLTAGIALAALLLAALLRSRRGAEVRPGTSTRIGPPSRSPPRIRPDPLVLCVMRT